MIMLEAKKVKLIVLIIALSGCAILPTSGPSGNKVVALGGQRATMAVPEVELIDLDESVARTH